MAIPRKGSRKISVGGYQYLWMATGNDGWIDLIVCISSGEGQKLKAQFNYHSVHLPVENAFRLTQKLNITPFIVKQVIIYGLNLGWTPGKKDSDLNLGFLDDKIDMTIRK